MKAFVPTPDAPAVLTANDLRTGRNLWRDAEGWSADPRAARLYTDAAAAAAALAEAEADALGVVGPYLAAARRADGWLHFREAFRQSGPSTEPAAQRHA